MKLLRQSIFFLQWVLILLSILATIFSSIEGFKMHLDLSSQGFQNYLTLFEPYSILFAATFIVVTSHLAIERLGLMNEANINSFRASNRTQWIQVVREFSNETRTDDPSLSKELLRHLISIHDYLFEKQYTISSQKETKEFFDKFFAERVKFFEEQNNKYLNIGCYLNDKHSYSWINVRYVLFAMVNIDDSYNEFITHIGEYYQEEVLKFSKPLIMPEAYQAAAEEYSKNKRQGTTIG
jgi:hypothetical protein